MTTDNIIEQIEYAEQEKRAKLAQRREYMRMMHERGMTLEAIGKIFHISRQRVYQILKGEDK